MYSAMFGDFGTASFSKIFPNEITFLAEYNRFDLKAADLTESDLSLIYKLLLAEYANSHIRSYDTGRFELQLFSKVYQYAPTWKKKNELQQQIRSLTAEQMAQGDKSINNTAFGDETNPSTATLEEINYINSQNTTNKKRGKAESAIFQYSILQDDITKDFLDKFKVLFIKVAYPRSQTLYETEVKE